MRALLKFFLRGLVVVAPLAVTIWICAKLFETIDGWLGFRYRGAGFLAMIVVITLVGFLASTLLAKALIAAVESLFDRLPFVRLLYTSTKDMLNAFVGEQRRFDKPVLVTLSADGIVKAIGFLTSESLAFLGVDYHVTVYIPQSYGFSGNIIIVPSTQVQRLDADAAEVMAYVISAGVTDVEKRKEKSSVVGSRVVLNPKP